MTNLERVLSAVCRGYRTPKAIAHASGVCKSDTRMCLTRLMDAGRVGATPAGGKLKHYYVKDPGCLLEEFWKHITPTDSAISTDEG